MVEWFDARKSSFIFFLRNFGVSQINYYQKIYMCEFDTFDLKDITKSDFAGFVLNIPRKKFHFFEGRHWLTVKNVEDKWWNLDSSKKVPEEMDSEKATKFICEWIHKRGELMIIRKVQQSVTSSDTLNRSETLTSETIEEKK
ncbi:josephin-1 [Reticulomyxa filosa]|uniref:ubiquitinyl hydrolase 1 n=1 Tax=Reticulomyxa filosa TaxID=46433 RepID=X6NXT8_RETFI|nr:josephin-1 [Reticulomyxa filosa]|eukprot:ETO30796.1 josephin-1 [Reticulomyxa filosa]